VEARQKVMGRVVWGAAYVFGFLTVVLPLAAQRAQPAQSVELSANVSSAPSSPNIGEKAEPSELPDSPDVILSANGETSQVQSERQANTKELWAAALMQPRSAVAESDQNEAPRTQSSANQPTQTPSTAAPQTSPQQKPVGTAAAEAPSASGVAASQPAGVAIAPAKQRRVRTIVLRTGAIIGAGVAVGTVVALTAGTSSKPPGAH
jgi:hypothetical protein